MEKRKEGNFFPYLSRLSCLVGFFRILCRYRISLEIRKAPTTLNKENVSLSFTYFPQLSNLK